MSDLNNVRIGLHLLKKYRPDFFAVYLQGIDHLCHVGWHHIEPDKFAISKARLRKYEGVIPAYYSFLDAMIGEYMEHADEDTVVLIASDHGFEPIRIETREGREEYAALQKQYVEAASPIRQDLLKTYQRLLQKLCKPCKPRA